MSMLCGRTRADRLHPACSAVDHHTAEHMFNHCIKGLFGRKATVLVTHQLQVRALLQRKPKNKPPKTLRRCL